MSSDDSRQWQKHLGRIPESNVMGGPCFCTGPVNGEPYCPCMMKMHRVYKRDGRWIQPEQDLGSCK